MDIWEALFGKVLATGKFSPPGIYLHLRRIHLVCAGEHMNR
jgi:hypothetical protein